MGRVIVTRIYQGVTQSVLKIGEIRELIRLMDETSLGELNLESENMKLHLKKTETVQTVVQAAPVVVPQAAAPTPVVAAVPASAPVQTDHAAAPAPQAAVADEANVHVIKSPMVGTFYRSPSPDAPAFVDKGGQVSEKTIVCIVEAMKLMNEIEAEVSGEVVEVLAQNGQLVEYGQPLFKIKLA